MKLAYLIIAHRDLPQAVRLIDRLAHPEAAFFVHVDRKVDDTAYRGFAQALQPYRAVLVEPRLDVRWGGYSLVRATLAALSAALDSPEPWDYVQLLSGQDYPLASAAGIARWLAGAGGREFIDHCELSRDWEGAMHRFQRYHFHDALGTGWLCDAAEKAVNAVLPQRKPPLGLTPYGGSGWWTLTGACARHVLDTARREPSLARFFRTTHVPDEIFFQTLVLNSRFAANVVNDNLRYVDWSAKGRHPRTLTAEDLPKLLASGKLFARKFDAGVDAAVLDRLDASARSAPPP